MTWRSGVQISTLTPNVNFTLVLASNDVMIKSAYLLPQFHNCNLPFRHQSDSSSPVLFGNPINTTTDQNHVGILEFKTHRFVTLCLIKKVILPNIFDRSATAKRIIRSLRNIGNDTYILLFRPNSLIELVNHTNRIPMALINL